MVIFSMKYYLFLIIFILPYKAFSDSKNVEPILEMVEIQTKDGNIFLGKISHSTEKFIQIHTKDSLFIEVPKSKIIAIDTIYTRNNDGLLLRADPNKSLYIFAPSAFPIEQNKSYCRDFCVFFPSYNKGLKNNISVQIGAFIFGPMPIAMTPLVFSGKYSLPNSKKTENFNLSYALGVMYVRMPFSDSSNSGYGFGVSFGTVTIGNRFNHASFSMGMGYSNSDGDWEFADRPLLNFAGNKRLSNKLAIVGEQWIFPDIDLKNSPLLLSARLIGRKFTFDFGGLFTAGSLLETLPMPIVNITYHK